MASRRGEKLTAGLEVVALKGLSHEEARGIILDQLSVIIPTRNRAQSLDRLLRSLAEQDARASDYEVVVVNNGSTDLTREVVRSHRNTPLNLVYCEAPRPGLHVARHQGLAVAGSENLLFADDDIEPSATWVSAIGESLSSGVSLAGGNVLPRFEAPPPEWLVTLWEEAWSRDRKYRVLPSLSLVEWRGGSEFDPFLVLGCNFGVKRSVLQSCHGFHPDGFPRELIKFRGDGETHVSRFVFRNKLSAGFVPDATVFHWISPSRMVLSYFHERGFMQGVSDSYADTRAETKRITRAIRGYLRPKLRSFQIGAGATRLPTNHCDLAKKAYWAGLGEGYSFHQSVYAGDPDVRQWVHQAAYLTQVV